MVRLLRLFAALGAAALAGASSAAEVSVSGSDIAYFQQSEPLLRSIMASDWAAAAVAASQLARLPQPGAVAMADVHSTIGIAYGEGGRFKEGIAHLQTALAVERGDLPVALAGLVDEALAYAALFHAALGQFDEAARLFRLLEAPPPWLFAKLATVYAGLEQRDCAIANLGAAQQAGEDGGAVVSRWSARHTDAAQERAIVLREWSEYRQALLQTGESEVAAEAAVCVGA